MLSHVWLFATSWTVACLSPLSMGFSREEYWSRLSFPLLGNLASAGVKLASPELQADSRETKIPEKGGPFRVELSGACVFAFPGLWWFWEWAKEQDFTWTEGCCSEKEKLAMLSAVVLDGVRNWDLRVLQLVAIIFSEETRWILTLAAAKNQAKGV